MIDEKVPWRIIADLNSPAMLEQIGNHNGYMRRYDIGNSDELFSKRYTPVILDELAHISNLFYNAYNSLITDYLNYEADYKKLDICDFKKQTIFEREPITRQQFFKLFPAEYWMRVFVYLKNYEEAKGLTQTKFENIVREANNFVSVGKIEQALLYVNGFFKDFNHVQYFSSLQNQNKTVEQVVHNTIPPELVF